MAQLNSQSITVRIEKLVYGGEGLARVDGQVLLSPYVLPGEQVSVEPRRVKTGLLRGTQPTILEAAAARVEPRCEYFGTCGGCQYQHAEYAFQLEQKQIILRETLLRSAGIDYPGDIAILSGEPWNYRNRVQLHFERGRSGFHRLGSHELCDIDHCYISSPILVAAITKLDRAAKAPQWPEFVRSVELFTNDHDLQLTVADTTRPVAARFFDWCATFLENFAPGAIEYEAAGHTFRVSRGSFFQVNRFLIDALVNESVGNYSGEQAVDLYAGVGLFSVALAQRFQRVEAIERGGPAYRDLEHNASNASNLKTLRSPAEDFLRELRQPPHLILADPPRAGLGRDATVELLRLQPQHLVLVSCDPSTMSRDLKTLLTAYEIERMTLIDLFPQTYHFETIVHLRVK